MPDHGKGNYVDAQVLCLNEATEENRMCLVYAILFNMGKSTLEMSADGFVDLGGEY